MVLAGLGNRDALVQVFLNLVKNAAEAIEAVPEADRGQGEIAVAVRREAGETVVIEVTDNGKGFPVEGRQRLLEPYMTTREGGTGLGLAIVAKIFEEHGGGIELADNPEGRGGRVRMWFPTNAGAEQTDAATSLTLQEPRRARA